MTKLKDASQFLKNTLSSGHAYFEIVVPSTKEQVKIRSLDIGEMSSISKAAMGEKETFYKTLTNLISVVSDGEIDVQSLTDLDRIYILSKIKEFNSTKTEKMSLTCHYCDESFEHTLDLGKFIDEDGILSYDYETVFKTYPCGTLKVIIEIGRPLVSQILSFGDLVTSEKNKKLRSLNKELSSIPEAIRNERIKKELSKIEAHYAQYAIITFLRSAQIVSDDVPTTSVSFSGEPIKDIIEFFIPLSAMIFSGLKSDIALTFSKSVNLTKYQFKCPNPECNAEFEDTVNIDSFFTF